VQILSVEEERQHGLSHGAFSYLVKPGTTQDLEQAFDRIKSYVVPHKKRLLVVEDNDIERAGIVELVMHDDIEVAAVGTGEEALTVLREQPVECCVVDLRLPDMSGFDLLGRMQSEPSLRDTPVVVFTGKELSSEEEAQLKMVAKSVVLKDVQSPERLLDETALFLHRVVADLPEPKRKMLERLHNSNEVLRGRVVLVDIMMPEMDGYQTMREIRRDPQFGTLPMLALTAKAMKGDREKCLEAGASDYIAKPVNTDQLLSLLRVWLYR